MTYSAVCSYITDLNVIVVADAAQHVFWYLNAVYKCPHPEEAPYHKKLHVKPIRNSDWSCLLCSTLAPA